MTKRRRPHIPLWWLSFADDTGHLGVCLVRGRDLEEALRICWRLKINPGGGVQSCRVPVAKEGDVPFEAIGKLLTVDDLNRLIPGAGAVRVTL